jgi:hypothetical protein
MDAKTYKTYKVANNSSTTLTVKEILDFVRALEADNVPADTAVALSTSIGRDFRETSSCSMSVSFEVKNG